MQRWRASSAGCWVPLTAWKPWCIRVLSVSSSPPPCPEAHKFILVEGSCKVFAASDSALSTLRWREVHAPSWGGPAAGYRHRQRRRAKQCKTWVLNCRVRAVIFSDSWHQSSEHSLHYGASSPSLSWLGQDQPSCITLRAENLKKRSKRRCCPTALSKNGSPVYLKILAFKNL